MSRNIKNGELLLQTPGLYEELDALYKELWPFLGVEHNDDGTHIVDDPTSNVAPSDVAYVTVGNTSSLANERALTGTANEVDVTDNGAGSTVAIGLPAAVTITTSLSVPSATVSGLTVGRVPVVGTGGLLTDDADLTFTGSILTATDIVATTDLNIGGAIGASATVRLFTKKVTGIADNVATDILTVTVPNANEAASIELTLLSSNGSTDAFESSRVAKGELVVARTTGTNAVVADTVLDKVAIATVAGGATHTLAYNVTAVSGAVGAANTFTIQVTINDSGNVGSNQLVLFCQLLSAETGGITIA